MKIVLLFLLSCCSGILYRMGGTSLGTKWRDCGCPVVALVALWLLNGFKLPLWWAYLLTFGLMWGAMTTYWKKKGEDAKWWNWLVTGICYGLAFLPFVWATGHWLGLLAYASTLGFLTMAWSETISWDITEEFGRGFLIIGLIWMLFI